jgi:hypothetical protein
MRQREKRGTGWTRPWNKAGMTVFQVHTHDPAADEGYFQMLLPLLDRALVRASPAYRDFVVELLQDPSLVALTFYHNREDDGRQYEGLTLSLGRVVPKEPSKRDRVDIVLEDEREHGSVDGLVDTVRVYVCPWFTYGHNRNYHLSEGFAARGDAFRVVQEVYQRCISRFHSCKHPADLNGTHWSHRYVEHFGPRQFVPQGSSFT